MEKVPPQNLDAERSVIGSMLMDKNAIVNVSGWLLPEHFYDERHAQIYKVIVDLFLDNIPVDLVTVADKLNKEKILKKVGGRAYLTELINSVPTASHAEEYAELVKEAATRRGLLSSASEITSLSFDESIPIAEVVDKSENLLFNVAQAGVKTNFLHIKELLKEAYERAERADKDEAYETKENASYLSSELAYWSTLDQKISQILKKIGQYEEAQTLTSNTDEDIKKLAKEEMSRLEVEISRLENEITQLQIERKFHDIDDNKPAILEIRAGAGGEEASLFAADLFRMYKNYAENKGWSFQIIDSSISEAGGYKEVIVHIKGEDVYKILKYESGVHRVQRVPVTEASGRIHTSTVSVAVLPEAEEIDIEIKPEDIHIEVMRASGAGGQCVNRTDSAVRITHIPTGIIVSCQETKHQAQNKEKAMTLLRSRLYEKKKIEEHEKRSNLRSSLIGSAMRAEKIRTYNYPQNRVTDHRIKKSWHNLESILNGDLDDMLKEVRDGIQKQLLNE